MPQSWIVLRILHVGNDNLGTFGRVTHPPEFFYFFLHSNSVQYMHIFKIQITRNLDTKKQVRKY